MRHACLLALLACAPVALGAPGSVQLRASSAPITGDVRALPGGAQVVVASKDAPGANLLVAWHRVRALNGEPMGAWAEVSDALMRAVARIERGDAPGAAEAAEPILRAGLAGGQLPQGPTAMALLETLLRARLERGSQTASTLAWLRWHQAWQQRPGPDSGQQWVGASLYLAPIIDADTGLCPSLPPAFGPSVSLQALGALLRSPEWQGLTGAPGPAGELAGAYRAAAAFEENGTELAEALPGTSDSAQLVAEIVSARAGVSAVRAGARAKLQARAAALSRDEATRETEGADDAEPVADGSWQRAWVHLGIGRSLLREDDAAQRRAGVLELLHVPALYGDRLPALAGLALLDARRELTSQRAQPGEAGAGLEGIERDIRERFGALAWVLDAP